jgi:hypothetical protein
MAKRVLRYTLKEFCENQSNLPIKASVELANRQVLFGKVLNINTEICVLETKIGKKITINSTEIIEIHTDKVSTW